MSVSLVRRVGVPILLLALLVSAAPDAAQAKRKPLAAPRVVVAVIESTSTNPYHEFFNAGGPLYGVSAPSSVTPDVLREFGIKKKHIIELTRTGDFDVDFEADRAEWEAIKYGQPYWFKGTNIIGISFNPRDGQRLTPKAPGSNTSTHAVGTTAAVLTANPEAVVVIVESPFAPLAVPGWGTAPEGERWAFNHPAVDMISTSYGPPFSPPLGYHLEESYDGVVENGKLHFGAADNSPALSPIDATAGPWWSIGIAGYAEGGSEGRELQSGSLPDFVGDWTQTLPYCRSCETGTRTVSGTSFATPRIAGTVSKAVLDLRRAAAQEGGIVTAGVDQPTMVLGGGFDLTNWEVRRAFEEAAYYLKLSDYKGGGDEVPVVEQAPWLQTGWGVITPDPARGVVTEALARLGIGGPATRSKSAAACAFMTANIEARRAWWDRVAPFSQSAGEDAYIYC